MHRIAVLVLAAGKSSRMKSIKQLAKIHDQYLLEITLKKAKEIAPKNTFCVLGAHAEIIKKHIDFRNIQIINNKNFELGLSTSIISAIHFIENQQILVNAVLILLADQPAIEISYLKDIIDLYQQNSKKIIASKYKTIYGVPAVIPSFYFKDLLKIKGDKGAKKFLNNNLEVIISTKKETNLIDIDTLDELKLFINS